MLELVVFIFSLALVVVALTVELTYLWSLFGERRIRRLIRSSLTDPALWNRAEAVRYVKKFFDFSD